MLLIMGGISAWSEMSILIVSIASDLQYSTSKILFLFLHHTLNWNMIYSVLVKCNVILQYRGKYDVILFTVSSKKKIKYYLVSW